MPTKSSRNGSRGGAREGAGRPKLEDAGVSVSGRIPPTVVKKLDAKAKRLGITRSQAVSVAVKMFLAV